jgi:biopolymer transport protein TolR
MAGGARKDDDDIISDINVTPFVDIVLVLLIIFMVTATYIVSRAIPVDLPRASSGEDVTTTLALTLTKNGDLYLDGRKVGEDDVRRAIASAKRNNREARAVIAADKEVQHGRVVHIIDLVRKQGVTRFAINIESE